MKKSQEFFVILVFLAMLFFIEGATANTWKSTTQTDFNSGTYVNTTSNSSNVIFLNQTEYHSNYKDENLVMWMHLNNDSAYTESTTKVYDFSNYGNNGTPVGAFWNATGKFNGSYTFDGSNDYIICGNGNSLKFGGSFTLAAWIYPHDNMTDATWGDPIINKESSGKGYQLTWHKTGKFGLMVSGGSASITWGNASKPYDTWYHVVGVFDGSKVYIYVNGSLENSAADTFLANTANALLLGFYSSRPFNGSIDEVAIWNRSLSADEILDLYKHTKGLYSVAINDTTNLSSFTHLNFSTTGNDSNNNITFQVRSCDDISCSGESFVGYDGTSNTYFNTTQDSWYINFIPSNRYIQWRTFFARNNTGNPILVNVSIGYEKGLYSAVKNVIPFTKKFPYIKLSGNSSTMSFPYIQLGKSLKFE